MDDHEWVTEHFVRHRTQLRGVWWWTPARRAALRTRQSFREDLNIELSHVLRVSDCIDRDDLPICDREPQYDAQLSLQHNRQSHRSIHKREARRSGPTFEGLGNSRSAPQFGHSTQLHGRLIGPEYD